MSKPIYLCSNCVQVSKLSCRFSCLKSRLAYVIVSFINSKLTSSIKHREAIKASLLECALSIFKARYAINRCYSENPFLYFRCSTLNLSRCEAKPDDEISAMTSSTYSSITLPTNHDRHSHHQHARSNLKASLLMNSNSSLTATQHQQLLSQLIRLDNQKKNQLSSSTLASLLQTPIQPQQSRSLSTDPNDPLQPKLKRFKGSLDSSINNNNNLSSSKKLYRKLNHVSFLIDRSISLCFQQIYSFLCSLTN